jgi:hypothetical protein
MENFLVIYLLVVGQFCPIAIGFSHNSEYYTFYDLDDVAIKVHQLIKERSMYKDLVDEGNYFKLYKITLSADIESSDNGFSIKTNYYKNIEEISLPKSEIEGTKYIYFYKKMDKESTTP